MNGRRIEGGLVAVACALAAATAGVALAAYEWPALQALWLEVYFLCQ